MAEGVESDDDAVMPANILPYDEPDEPFTAIGEDFITHVMHLAERQIELLRSASASDVRATQIGAWSALWVHAADARRALADRMAPHSRRRKHMRSLRTDSVRAADLDGDNPFVELQGDPTPAFDVPQTRVSEADMPELLQRLREIDSRRSTADQRELRFSDPAADT